MSAAPTHDHAIRLTIFPNFAAKTKREEDLSIPTLLDRIASTNAHQKADLPWLKLARFGNLRSDKNSIRHDRNVLGITGIEGDYDGEVISVDVAISALRCAGILAIVYTSPSHTEARPRWRVCCPTSAELPPDQRTTLLNRLNGVLDGILASESWTLSQSYYYGSVNNNPAHRVAFIEGTPIDLRPDLDARAIGNPRDKPAAASTRPASHGAAHGPVSEKRYEAYRLKVLENLRCEAVDGQKHFALLRHAKVLGGIQASADFTDETAVQWLLDALPDTVADWKLAERTAEDGLAYGRAEPIELDDRRQANGHDTRRPVDDIPQDWPADNPDCWEGRDPPTNGDDTSEGAQKPGKSSKPSGPFPPLLDAAEFMATFTNPDYLIDGIIQRGRVHALTSMTGHGKTAGALYFGCSIATGRNVGNIEVVQGEVVFLAGENPDDLCGRFHAACQFYGIDPAKLPIRVMPGNFPLAAETAETLKQTIDAGGRETTLIIGDSAAAYFPGDDDNQNVQMGDFARNLRVLTKCKGKPAVLILCHPVKAATKENLLPRGGGAFLNEIDANLTLWSEAQGETSTLHWQGKIRGADFQPVSLSLKQVKLDKLRDAKGRAFVSIVATLQTEEQAEKAIRQTTLDENTVLEWLRREPGISLANIAANAHWTNDKGAPNRAKVQRLLKSLAALKLAKSWRGKWQITDAGKVELSAKS